MGGESNDRRPREEKGPPRSEAPQVPPDAVDDEHVRAAWRSWLSALATDADAAMAAALAYESMPPEGCDAWLDVLDTEASALEVPTPALYMPLLAVEKDGGRRDRIQVALAAHPVKRRDGLDDARALRGVARDGTHTCVLVAPLYLDFVQVLTCRYTPSGGFVSVRHDLFRHAADVLPRVEVDGVAVEPTPLRLVVDELAHAILADRRERRAPPMGLASFAHLFSPHLDDCEDAVPPEP